MLLFTTLCILNVSPVHHLTAVFPLNRVIEPVCRVNPGSTHRTLTRCSRAVLISSHFVGVQNSTAHPHCHASSLCEWTNMIFTACFDWETFGFRLCAKQWSELFPATNWWFTLDDQFASHGECDSEPVRTVRGPLMGAFPKVWENTTRTLSAQPRRVCCRKPCFTNREPRAFISSYSDYQIPTCK